jgi:biotin operon repressor
MQYERSLEIERRLEHVLQLIKTGQYSTPLLAEEVGVSIPTISRCVCALRERGFDIRSQRHGTSWPHVFVQTKNHAICASSGELSQVGR